MCCPGGDGARSAARPARGGHVGAPPRSRTGGGGSNSTSASAGRRPPDARRGGVRPAHLCNARWRSTGHGRGAPCRRNREEGGLATRGRPSRGGPQHSAQSRGAGEALHSASTASKVCCCTLLRVARLDHGGPTRGRAPPRRSPAAAAAQPHARRRGHRLCRSCAFIGLLPLCPPARPLLTAALKEALLPVVEAASSQRSPHSLSPASASRPCPPAARWPLIDVIALACGQSPPLQPQEQGGAQGGPHGRRASSVVGEGG